MPRIPLRPPRVASGLAAVLAAAALLACHPFAAAELTEMTPRGDIESGELECWLTMEFARLPGDGDPTDVRVRFDSVALERPAEFGWDFIAVRDVVSRGSAAGSGYGPNPETRPEAPPPLGDPIVVRFPLEARRVIEDAPDTLVLHATLYWGGRERSSLARPIERVDRGEDAGL